jgi:hypothetical protein
MKILFLGKALEVYGQLMYGIMKRNTGSISRTNVLIVRGCPGLGGAFALRALAAEGNDINVCAFVINPQSDVELLKKLPWRNVR